MKKLKCIIIKHDSESEHEYNNGSERHTHQENGTHDVIREALASMNGYNDYLAKHGSHFTDKLANWASSKMQNVHGDAQHNWSVDDVKSAFERLGYKKPEENTWGDAAYSANMHYADYFGETLKTEAECIKQAYADITDPDGYPGKIFNRWASDVMGKKISVPWKDFI